MTGSAPPPSEQASGPGLVPVSKPRPFTTLERVGIGCVALLLLITLAVDVVLFRTLPATQAAPIYGTEAEAWVAGVIGLEVWLHFLEYRRGAPAPPIIKIGTEPGQPPVPPGSDKKP